MLTASPNTAAIAHETLRERLGQLNLPTWRCDSAGLLVSEPQIAGPAGLLLRSGRIAGLISRTIKGLAENQGTQLVEPEPGFYVIAVAERHRRQRSGWTVGVALSVEFLDSECFVQGCHGVHLDVIATRIALRPLALHDRAGAEVLAAMMGWAAADIASGMESQHTIAGFTRQLTDGFETIDLLYSLGRFMGDPTQPHEFINRALERLAQSMQFGWVGCWIGADPRVKYVRSERTFVAGTRPPAHADVTAAAELLCARLTSESKPLILNDAADLPLPRGVQCLAQPVARNARLMGVLMAGDKQGEDPQVSSYDIHLLETAGAFIAAFLENAILYGEQSAMFLGSLKALTSSLDAKDRYTFGHSERVAHLARELALAHGLPAATAERLHIAGLVHDVGKIGVPEAVLLKPGKLTEEEFGLIKRHPEIGHTILKDIPLMQDILPGVLHHHERYDGKGYPHRLAGEAIPLFGRILAIADTFDAMSSNRSYRPALAREQVLAELRRCAGTQLDPVLVPVFLSLDLSSFDRLMAFHREHLVDVTARAA